MLRHSPNASGTLFRTAYIVAMTALEWAVLKYFAASSTVRAFFKPFIWSPKPAGSRCLSLIFSRPLSKQSAGWPENR